jgi:sugar transferase (PEP-CTERM system associated)
LRVLKHHISDRSVMTATLDLTVLVAVAVGSVVSVEMIHGLEQATAVPEFSLALVSVTMLMIIAIGFYDKRVLANFDRFAFRLFVGLTLSIVVSAPLLYLVASAITTTYPQFYLRGLELKLALAFVILAFIGLAIARKAAAPLLRSQRLHRSVLVLGAGEHAARLAHLVGSSPMITAALHFVDLEHRLDRAVGFGPTELAPRVVGVPYSEPLKRLATRFDVDEIVVADDNARALPVEDLLECKFSGIPVTNYLSFYEREARRIDLDLMDPQWFIFSDGFDIRGLELLCKRGLDVLVSALALLTFAVPCAVVALLIRWESPGPAIYRQKRVGLGGKSFTLYKFRSMRQQPAAVEERWAAANDVRVTRIGAFIRRHRIDELPQLVNVLNGDMSLVGPRPEQPMFVATLSQQIRYYDERHRVKPGITGWAQLNYRYGASVDDARVKLAYDLYYIKNFSLLLDLLILVQTTRLILWPEGAR